MVLCNSMRPLQSPVLFSSFLTIALCFPSVISLNFSLTNINPQTQNITLEGDAYISSQGIQLTPDELDVERNQTAGQAMYVESLPLWDKATGNLADFNTHFVFVIDSEGSPNFADGLTFLLIPPGNSNIHAGGSLRLPIDPLTNGAASPFVAIEFDSFPDAGGNNWDPANITHVGIDINSLISNVTAKWESDIPSGRKNEARINYNSTSKNLSVVFTGTRNDETIIQGLSLLVDLRNYLPESVRIGVPTPIIKSGLQLGMLFMFLVLKFLCPFYRKECL